MTPVIKVSPVDSMFDYSDLKITLENLTSGQELTVICALHPNTNEKDVFESYAYYFANEDGRVDCSRDVSTGGSYKGIEPTGLLWSLTAAPGSRKGAAFVPNDVSMPVEYKLYVKNGHVKPDLDSGVLNSVIFRRHVLHPDVARIEIESGRIRGTLFKPKDANDSRKCSAVIDLYGTRGGINEHRAALIASHGYATLALAYFRYKDLPDALEDGIDLEYFEESIDFLLNLPYVRSDGVAVIGSSLGGDLGVLLSTISPKIKAVVSINGYHMLNEMFPFKYKGVALPVKRGTFTDEFLTDGHIDMRAYRRSLTNDPELIYQIEKSSANFLFICGDQDLNTDSLVTANIFAQRLQNHGKEKLRGMAWQESWQGEILVLQGAGHLLEPPYIPHVYLAFSRAYGLFSLFGGQMAAHAKGQIIAWKKTLESFQRCLEAPLRMRILGVDAISRL